MTGGKPRLAVVLFNLGGPDSQAAVRPFLFNLFNDKAIIGAPAPVRLLIAALISATRAKSARANYAIMGGASPLPRETEAQRAALERALAGAQPDREVRVFTAMRYWNPMTAEAAREVAAFAPVEVLLLPLYPQFSTTTTASSVEAWAKAYTGPGLARTVCCYPTLDGLAASHAAKIKQVWEAAGRPENLRLLFSAHGLPEQVIERGDPYQAQVEATSAAVAARLPFADWQVCYQSRVGPLKWIGPSTPDAIAGAAAEGLGVILCPIAFVSEHIETLVELDHEYAELAASLDCVPYLRAPAVGVTPDFIDGLASAVGRALARGPGIASDGCPRWCPTGFTACPSRDTASGRAAA